MNRTYRDRAAWAFLCVVASFGQQLHALRIRMHVNATLGGVRGGVHWLGRRGERDTDKFGGHVEPPISSSGDGDRVDEFIFVRRNTCCNDRPTLSFSLPPGRENFVEGGFVRAIRHKRSEEVQITIFFRLKVCLLDDLRGTTRKTKW